MKYLFFYDTCIINLKSCQLLKMAETGLTIKILPGNQHIINPTFQISFIWLCTQNSLSSQIPYPYIFSRSEVYHN